MVAPKKYATFAGQITRADGNEIDDQHNFLPHAFSRMRICNHRGVCRLWAGAYPAVKGQSAHINKYLKRTSPSKWKTSCRLQACKGSLRLTQRQTSTAASSERNDFSVECSTIQFTAKLVITGACNGPCNPRALSTPPYVYSKKWLPTVLKPLPYAAVFHCQVQNVFKPVAPKNTPHLPHTWCHTASTAFVVALTCLCVRVWTLKFMQCKC